jgi:hypothetical protein
MGKGSSLTIEELLARAERARKEGIALYWQLRALYEMRLLQEDFRTVTRGLAAAMRAEHLAVNTDEGLRTLLLIAEDILVTPPGLAFVIR